MKKLFLIMSALFLSTTSDLKAQEYSDFCCEETYCENRNFYAEIFGGANFLQTQTSGGIRSDYQTGYIVSGSLGYRWCYGLRTEFEYAYRRNEIRKIHFFGRSFSINGHFQSSSYMGNLIWDLPFCAWGCNFWGIQPFIGGGIGYDFQQVHAHNEGLTLNQHKKGFAWQVIAGLSYPIFCNTDISLEYKFHKGGLNYIENHSIGVGLKYNFGLCR